jgi:hypothetical protein
MGRSIAAMRYLRRRLARISTLYLAAYVALTDVVLFAGVVPFELYCRSAILRHHGDVRFLLEVLAANAGALLLLLSAMLVSGVLFGRGAMGALRVILPGLRPLRVPVRSRPSAR